MTQRKGTQDDPVRISMRPSVLLTAACTFDTVLPEIIASGNLGDTFSQLLLLSVSC